MKSILLATTALLLAGPSFAADAILDIPEAPVAVETPVAFSWAGGYLGVQGGFGFTSGDFTDVDNGDVESNDFEGAVFGAFAGYNYQFDNNVVIGVEGDIEYHWNEDDFETELGDATAEMNLQGAVRGRLGYAFDRTLFYVAAGWTAAQAEAEIADGGDVFRDDAVFNGYTIGAGVDYAINDRIFARVDYRYNEFDSEILTFGDVDIDTELSQHTIKAGLGVKF
ncbi:porin family protein [Pseudohoeflea suaedae]|uniref:Porin family protein n=1 Tax=Pseudohoeflea suaedae TaxID=877384 RepID=A0A4R5PPE8_9HYPH|nr:outer membrane protein [Pseudohoeflea suaedae]TDH38960.1 porin family protein [Pseudohoeflea suaedae]